MKRIPFYVFCLANMAMGALNLIWGNFDAAHQPIQAFADRIPGVHIYAYITGVLLAGGGLLLLFGRGRRAAWGAIVLAAINLVIAMFWLPRFYTAPHYLGLSLSVVSGVLGGVCRQLVIVTAALLAYVQLSRRESARQDRVGEAARWIFGCSSLDFGIVHLTTVSGNLAYVPLWMPLGRAFWVVFTGIAFILAGLAILIRLADVAATWLLGLMLLVFSAVTLIPGLIASAHGLENWGGNVHEFVLVGAVWMFAQWMHARERSAQPSVAAA